MVGIGFTVMVNVFVGPEQIGVPLYLGVTVMVAVTGKAVPLAATKDTMVPVPLAANPIDVSLLVQS